MMATQISVEEALAAEVRRVLEDIGGDDYRTQPRTIRDGPLNLEEVGSHGFPAIGFEIDDVQTQWHGTGRVRSAYGVTLYLYAKAAYGIDARTAVLALKQDVERALMKSWKDHATPTNLHNATGADFIGWLPAEPGLVTYGPGKKGAGLALDVCFTALIVRDFDRP